MTEADDFLLSKNLEINFFVNCASPFWVSTFIHILSGKTYEDLLVTLDLLLDDQKIIVKYVLILASIEVFACIMLIFNPFEK